MNYVVIVHTPVSIRAYGVDGWDKAVGLMKRSVKAGHRCEVVEGSIFLRDKDRLWPCMEEIETMVWQQTHARSVCDYDAGLHQVVAKEEVVQDG